LYQVINSPEIDPDRLLDLVRAQNWFALEASAPSILKSWKRLAGVGMRQILFRKLSWCAVQIGSLPNSRGLSVALLGPDGAGKSTLMEGIKGSFVLPVVPVYMGLTGGALRYIDKLNLPIIVIPARLLVFWSRYLRAVYHQMHGRLVIFDRYIYDYAVPTPFPLNRLQRWTRWIDGH
jgi:hypothetical protein